MSEEIKDLLIEQRELMLAIARKQKQQEEALIRLSRIVLLHTNAGSYKKSEQDFILYGEQTNVNN